MNKKKSFLIFSIKAMRYLEENGLKYFATRQDKFNPNKIVFIYEHSEQLEKLLEEYKLKSKEHNSEEK